MIALSLLAAAGKANAVTAQELQLNVRETAGIARQGEVIRSGVPLPKNLNVRSTSGLAVVNAAGTAVPAEFKVLARWNSGKADANAPIQWLLVSFAADVAAQATAQYRLVIDGTRTNPSPSRRVTLTQSGNRVTVNTGVATFVVDGAAQSLFSELRAGSTLVGGAKTLDGTVDGRAVAHNTLRRVSIESQGPLSAVVVVDGAYDFPSIGGGGLGSKRRYEFRAGSPTAIVRHQVAFEGDKCNGSQGAKSCNGTPNGVLATRIQDGISLSLGSSRTIQAIGARSAAATQVAGNASTQAFVRQNLRAYRTNPRTFNLQAGATAVGGEAADGAMIAVSGGGNTVAIALDHMHMYEPQALRVNSDGSMSINIVDDKAWMAARQGVYGTFAVTAMTGNASRAELDRLTWAPLNAPLRAWPSNKWFADSKALGDLPTGALASTVSGYDALMKKVMDDTITKRAAHGLFGVSIFGSVPREWGGPNGSNEIECGDDPTPGEAWDNAFWCATWTDYHNGMNNAALRAARTGEVEYLDEIQEPAALRMMITQIFQCGPNDSFFYCGQSPAGYGAFRSDFNSSHAYFQNLMSYYWLTGDYTAVETIERGARSMRNYMCSKRPGAACSATDPRADEWAQLTGRTASQWYSAFRFVGLASNDASFLDDYRSGLARSVTQHYLEGNQNGARYGFFTTPASPITGAGSGSTDQLWMASMYDMHNLYQLQIDTDDAAIGSPAVAPSRVIAAWARTLGNFGSTVMGGGTWPNALSYATSGARIDGTLSSVAPNTSGGDPTLYDTGRADLVAVLVRGAQSLSDATLLSLGTTLTTQAIAAATNDNTPMSKRQALFLSQLHGAVARLSNGAGSAPTAQPIATVTTAPTTTTQPVTTVTEPVTTVTAPTTTTQTAETSGSSLLSATMENIADLTAAGATLSGISSANIVTGHAGNAVSFANGGRIQYAMSTTQLNELFKKGEIEFMLKAPYASNSSDDSHHTFVVIGDLSNPPALMIEESDTLNITYIDSSWTARKVATNWHAPVFAANTWVKIKARWDNAASDAMQLFVNDVRVDNGGQGAYTVSAPKLGIITIGSDNYGSYSAGAVIDSLIISAGSAAQTTASAPTSSSQTAAPSGTLALSTTLDSVSALTTPAVGPAGVLTAFSGSNIVTGYAGNAGNFISGGRVTYAMNATELTNVLRKGEIEFMLKAQYAANASDDSKHALVVIGDLSNPPALIVEESDTLNVTYIDASWTARKVATNWHAPVFAANTWVKITARWDAAASDPMQLYVNGSRVDTGGLAPYSVTAPRLAQINVGADSNGSYTANAQIDDLKIKAN